MVGINVWIVTVYVGNAEYSCLYNDLVNVLSLYILDVWGGSEQSSA